MRSDTKSQGVAFAESDPDSENSENSERSVRDSFSGHERDHFFANLGGERFVDLGGIYGLDHPGDGRTIAILDYDRDGWPDFAVASSNKPSLQLFRNQIGDIADRRPRFIALRLEGGNRTASPNQGFSSRDGYGARIEVETSVGAQALEARCGEGRATVHSRTMIIGLGEEMTAEHVRVRWPSGILTELRDVSSGTLVTIYEVAKDSPDGSGEQRAPYREIERTKERESPSLITAGDPSDELRVYVTMTTTCAACIRAKPSIERLQAECSEDAIGFYGVSIDPSESQDILERYIEQRHPPYEVLSEIDPSAVTALRERIKSTLGYESTPSTIVTDGEGRVLDVRAGVPTLSVLRKCLDSRERN